MFGAIAGVGVIALAYIVGLVMGLAIGAFLAKAG